MTRFACRSFLMTDAEVAVRMETARIDAFRCPLDVPTAWGSADVAEMAAEIRGSKLSLLAEGITSSRGRNVQVEDRGAADCRPTAVALALRLSPGRRGVGPSA